MHVPLLSAYKQSIKNKIMLRKFNKLMEISDNRRYFKRVLCNTDK